MIPSPIVQITDWILKAEKRGGAMMAQALAQEKCHTIYDIYSLPEGERAELIDGQIYHMAPPSRKHQDITGGFSEPSENIFGLTTDFAVPTSPRLPFFWTKMKKIMWNPTSVSSAIPES